MSTAISFTLTLTMTSDWHIGSGVGRQGAVDSLVVRDGDDLPYAPSSTVAAMWRDAAEQLAFGLDRTNRGGDGWTGLVTTLFGSQPGIGGYSGAAPAPSRLILEHLRLDETLREALKGPARASLRQALTFIKPGVRIDPRRETAMTDMLRFEEVCRSGAVLAGQATIDTTGIGADQDRDLLAAFALASLGLLERIGGGRRRGLGRCTARISGATGTTICSVGGALDHLDGHFKPPASGDPGDSPSRGVAPQVEALYPAAPSEVAFADSHHDRRQEPEFVEIPLRIEALSPLLIMDQQLGNVTTSLDHVPGTMLLPIVARALGNAGVCAKKVSRWITSSALSVAPAYATIDGERGLPMPMRWQWAKPDATASSKRASNAPLREAGADPGSGASTGSVATSSHPDGEAAGADASQDTTQRLHPKGGEVVARCGDRSEGGNGKAGYVTRRIGHVVQTHNTVQDDVQKPTEEVGGLYTYEAIRSGETLASVVRLPARDLGNDVLDEFRKQLCGPARIGAVGRRGYGSVRLKAGQCTRPAEDVLECCKSAVLWLTSDLCLPAPIGTRSPDVPGEAPGIGHQLAAALGQATSRSVKVTRSWLRTRRHESWHRQWGLPRPSLTLVRAGSVVVIEPCGGKDEFTKEDLANLVHRGAGERRAEGHGQIRVNALEVTCDDEFRISSHRTQAVKNGDRSDQPALCESSADPSTVKFARVVETAAWQIWLCRRAEEATATPEDRKCLLGWTPSRPSASQLGKMRSLLNGARTACDVSAVRDWLKSKPDGWEGAGAKLIEVLKDPFGSLGLAPTAGAKSASDGQEDPWPDDAPSALIRSLCDTCKDEELKRYAIAAIVHAALRAHRRAAEIPPEARGGAAQMDGGAGRQETG